VQDHTVIPSFQSRTTAVPRAGRPGPRGWAAGQRTWLHVLLFLLTVASTFFVSLGDGIAGALWYSGAVMAILLAHEMGHYFAAKRYGVPATLPYFIPLPLPPFGTMGAVIRMSGTIPDRRALMDIGAAGPLAGMVLIVPAIVVGLLKSPVVPVASLGADSFRLGNSLLFSILSRLLKGDIPAGSDVVLHPLAFAGWVGLFVTAINLLPVGQLDGGHVSYALFQNRSRAVTVTLYAAMAAVCLFLYAGWALFLVLLYLVRKHPPTLDDGLPLDRKRIVTGWLLFAVFVLSVTPVPFGVEGLIPLAWKGIQFLIRAVR
jgi:membrane-associated protease RseP (regulator of RpoE activity)